MKQQKIIRAENKVTNVVDERTPKIPESPINALPVRAVVYVEVKDMAQNQIRDLVTKVSQAYSTARGGVHYVIPVRHGKITSDILFEVEILDIVNKICEVQDGKIVLKDGATDVSIIRESV